jgi:hypothetical protein
MLCFHPFSRHSRTGRPRCARAFGLEPSDHLDGGRALGASHANAQRSGGGMRWLCRGRSPTPLPSGVGWWHDNRRTLITERSVLGRRRRVPHEHRGARLSRHALALLPLADGSEAPSPRRDRCAPVRGRREAQGGSRTATAGCVGPSISGGSLVATTGRFLPCFTLKPIDDQGNSLVGNAPAEFKSTSGKCQSATPVFLHTGLPCGCDL